MITMIIDLPSDAWERAKANAAARLRELEALPAPDEAEHDLIALLRAILAANVIDLEHGAIAQE